jgi:hypothetical protein
VVSVISGWFPKLRADGTIFSGNAGIWRTLPDGRISQVSPVGIGPILAAQTLIYNRNDGTTQIGLGDASSVLPTAYNKYRGSDDGQWAGATDSGLGHVDAYQGSTLLQRVPNATAPRFYGPHLGYLTPFQSVTRALVIGGITKAKGALTEDWYPDPGGAGYVYTVATGTYTRAIFTDKNENVTVRPQGDETPLACFLGPDGYPWILSNSPNAGTFVRMVYSAMGWVIAGELFNPDMRMIGDRLHVVGSLNNGQPRDVWIDFDPAKRVDLRLL